MDCNLKTRLFSVLLISCFLGNLVYAQTSLQKPILVLGNEKKFGSFTCEILKAEGFNEFQFESLTEKISLSYLSEYDIVILTEQAISPSQKDLFTSFVKKGGNLIAFKPDKKFNTVFGIQDAGSTLEDAYILIDAHTSIGKGLTNQSLQLHVSADQCKLNTGKSIAWLYKDAKTPTTFPAVVVNKFGKGHAMAFLYNLAQNIIYTRQGNYRSADKEMDGIVGLRAMDLFTNGWLDTTKNILNQADEQMRLLTHGIEQMSSYKKPLPRFWYFPGNLKCLVTLNNDGEETKEAEYIKQFDDVDSKGAKMTLYIKEVDFTSTAWVNKWKNKGFEMAAHYDDTRQAEHPDWKTMDSVYKDLNAKMKRVYGIDSIRTVVNHWFVWCGKDRQGKQDFTAQVKIEEQNGILLDANYAHYDNGSNQGHFLGAFGTNQGNYNGSGLPMKFSDLEGKIINVYQHFNSVYDQQYMEHDDKEGFFNCFKGLVDRSINDGVYSFVSVKAHNAEYFFSEKPLMKMLDYANQQEIPVWTEANLLEFLRSRDEATFSDLRWSGNKLSFKIKSSLAHASRLSCMIPYLNNGKKIRAITTNGKTKVCPVETIKGFRYALLSINPGEDCNVIITYL